MEKLFIGLYIFLTLVLLNSCGNRPHSEEQLEELEKNALAYPREQADSLMKLAKKIRNDDVSHYIDTALKARDYGAAEQFDSSAMMLLKVATFCKRQQPSKRIYNLLSYVENTFGSNILYSSSSAEESSPSAWSVKVAQQLNGIAGSDASEMAVRAYKNAVAHARLSGSDSRIPLIYYNLSMVYSGKGEPSSAAYYCRRALFAADSIGWSTKQSAFLYLALGESYANLNDFANAKKALDKGASVLSLLPHEDKALLYRNYGKIYTQQGNPRKALPYFKRALDEIKQGDVGIDYSYYSILLQYISCSIDCDKLPKLKDSIDESIRFFRQLGDRDNQLYAEVLQLKLALKEKNLGEANAIIRRVRAGVESDKTTSETKLAWYQNIDAYYRLKGNLAEAYPIYRKAVVLEDSIRGFAQKQYVANLGMTYRQDTTLLNNKIKDERQESDIRTLNWKYLTATMAGTIVVLCFIGYFVYTRRRHALQLQRYLSNMNRLKMQNIRNCISPHFTFNMLNREILLSPENGEVYKRLMDLAHLLRSSLDATNKIAIPLSQELDFTQMYIKTLQECGKTFDFRLHIADSINPEKVLIPSMLIQIPVENAIKHGFKSEEKDAERIIAVTVLDKKTGIAIDIINNGETYLPFNGDKNARKGIGMQVIYQSLLLMNMKNKEKITFSISDRRAENVEGTRVSIYVPYHFDYTV